MSAGKKNSGSSSVNNVFHIDKITFVWRHEASFGKLLQGFRNAHSQCKVLLLAVDQNFMSVAFQKVNVRCFETVKAEMNGLTPGLDRSPPPRWMGGQGGQSLKVFGRTRSFWGLSSPKIEMGGKALKWLSRLDYPLAKTGETVNGGAESAVHLDR